MNFIQRNSEILGAPAELFSVVSSSLSTGLQSGGQLHVICISHENIISVYFTVAIADAEVKVYGIQK